MTQVRWGLLSTAAIGATVVDVCRGSETVRFSAVASRDSGKASAFAEKHGLESAFGSYEELLASDVVDAVYVALPVSMHTEWTVKALEAGKHVLCEKPFATTGADAERAFAAAEAADRMCVEGFMWRHHPQTEHARRLLDEGAIGRLLLVRTALTVDVPEGDIRRSRSLGGGALGDLGCYCVSGTRYFGGEPERVYAVAVYDPDGVDLRLAGTMQLPDGVLAQLDVGLTHERRDELELVGSEGVLRIPDPWVGVSRHLVLRRHGEERLVAVPGTEGSGLGEDPDAVYRLEFERVSAAIASGTPLPHRRDDAVAQAAVLEALATSARAGKPIEPRRSGVTA